MWSIMLWPVSKLLGTFVFLIMCVALLASGLLYSVGSFPNLTYGLLSVVGLQDTIKDPQNLPYIAYVVLALIGIIWGQRRLLRRRDNSILALAHRLEYEPEDAAVLTKLSGGKLVNAPYVESEIRLRTENATLETENRLLRDDRQRLERDNKDLRNRLEQAQAGKEHLGNVAFALAGHAHGNSNSDINEEGGFMNQLALSLVTNQKENGAPALTHIPTATNEKN